MIRHIVILHFKREAQQDFFQLLQDTKPYIAQIPGIIEYNIFKNDSKYTPDNVYSLGVEILFEDENALQAFMDHPRHYEANTLFEKYLATPGFMVLTHHC